MKKSSQKKLTLDAQLRSVVGKKVKQIRKKGILPGNIFGPQFKSVSISIPLADFQKTYRSAGETGIVYINVEKESHPTLITNVQYHPVSDMLLHVDFRKIDLKQKIETAVPVEVKGQSPAVTQKGGVLLTLSKELIVEALPEEIPSHVEVDISIITELGQEIKVSDLAKSAAYTIKENPDKVVVSVVQHKEESVLPETAVKAPEVITEAKPEEGAETTGDEKAAPAETAKPAVEK